MFRLQLEHYVTLGKNLATLRQMLETPAAKAVVSRNGRSHVIEVSEAVVAAVGQLRDACGRLGLGVSLATIDKVMGKGLEASAQIETLLAIVESEMETRLFLHVPADRSRLWENNETVSNLVRRELPVAASEIRAAGTAYACGLWSASVFHSMRASEDALRTLANELEVELSGFEQWGNIIERIEAELAKIAKLPKANDKKKHNLQPISEIVQDLRVFKDAWRNQSAHNVVSYNDGQALTVFDAVCRVLEKVALRA